MGIGMRVLCGICAMAMLAGICLSAAAEKATLTQDMIERMVINYAAYGTRDNEAIAELTAMDSELGDKWTRIIDLWENPAPVNEEIPEDLPTDDSLCLVVLGFQLNPDGTMRDELIGRLEVALAVAEKYPQAFIVCTGGGTAANDDTATEAGRMAEWLLENGVDPARVKVEDHSVTTAQNAIYTFDILEADCPQVTSIAIISSHYHIETGALLFGAEAILRDNPTRVIGNAAWHAPSGSLPVTFQAGALIELSGDKATAFEIYYETYDIHELPPLPQDEADENK